MRMWKSPIQFKITVIAIFSKLSLSSFDSSVDLIDGFYSSVKLFHLIVLQNACFILRIQEVFFFDCVPVLFHKLNGAACLFFIW